MTTLMPLVILGMGVLSVYCFLQAAMPDPGKERDAYNNILYGWKPSGEGEDDHD